MVAGPIGGHCVVDLTIQGIENTGGIYENVFGHDVFVHVNVHRVGGDRSVQGQNYRE